MRCYEMNYSGSLFSHLSYLIDSRSVGEERCSARSECFFMLFKGVSLSMTFGRQ